MDFRLLFPSKYLAAHDLRGKDVTLTIRRVIVEELETDRGKKKKPVVYFEETKTKAEETGTEEKRLVLNVTNAKSIAKMHGNEIEGWAGKRITFFPTQAEAFGEMKDCLRIRPDVATPAANGKIGPE